MASRSDTYYVLVICDESGTVVGTGAVIVERKFIHGLGMSLRNTRPGLATAPRTLDDDNDLTKVAK